ncbi:MAG: cation-transporting P-type ATPase [Gammaproteobacteria bacterium]
MNDVVTREDALPWHAATSDETLRRLATDTGGLTAAEARRRMAQFGPNRLPPPPKRGPLTRFLLQFHNILIYVLLIAGLVTALEGHWVDAGVIFGVVVINAIIGFIQEGKAERALDAIRNMLSLQAVALRDGQRVTIAADELVPGDIVYLQSGDKVPADLRLLKVRDLRIDESVLTGESEAVEKGVAPVAADVTVGDRTCIAFSGTFVTYGQGSGVVVATGKATEIGRISALLAGVQQITTPLLRQIGEFGRQLTVAIIGLAALTFAIGYLLRDYSADEMFLAAVGLAVAAIPEGLPAVMTITLAIGVQRMARRNAIIRRLPAVETLGSVTVICSDKTGTLTRNEMTVQSVATAEHVFSVTGVGYAPHGGFTLEGKAIEPEEYPDLVALAKGALLCNDATLRHEAEHWSLQGDPTEGALLTVAMKAGLEPDRAHELWPRVDAIPFESQHRFMATLHRDHAGHRFILLKGAPEQVLERCSHQRVGGEDRPLEPALWHRRIEEIAQQGQRLLAVAMKAADEVRDELRFDDVEDGMTLLGVFGIIDPPREEAITAVRQCQEAGIRVKMITGDHAVTAQVIAAQLGIGHNGASLTGQQIETLSDEELRLKVREVDVFARASPEHKLRLVQALQANGEVVAMTGDGVNDAPALKRADIGVAMGQKGTEVSKEAAGMVLADDNFASIAHAVEEGRTVYDNLKKALLFLLPTNGGQALVIIIAILLGMVLPITPVQILWVNMVTAVTLGLALAFEPTEADAMRRPPRPPGTPILSGFMVWRVTFVALLLVAGTFSLFLWEESRGASPELARTVAVNTLVMCQILYLFSARYILAPACTRAGLFGSRYVLLSSAVIFALQLLFTYAPSMQALFRTEAIDLATWARILLVAIAVFTVVEMEKVVVRHATRRET